MRAAVEKRFDGLKEAIEESIEANEAAAEANEQASEALRREDPIDQITERVMAELDGQQSDGEVDGTAAKAAVAKGAGGGKDHPFPTSEDRAAAIAGYTGEDGESAAVAKARDSHDLGNGVERRAQLLRGTAEPRNSKERYLANLTGERKERIVSMLESEVPDADGNTGVAKAVKRASEESASGPAGGSVFKQAEPEHKHGSPFGPE